MEEEIEKFKEYINVLSEIQTELKKTGDVSFNYMKKFKDKDNILSNSNQLKDYETYLIGILDKKIESLETEINRIANEINDKNETQDVLNSIKSDKSLINLNRQLKIIQDIFKKYMKGKTSVYLNFNCAINLNKYCDYIFKNNIIFKDNSVFVKTEKNDKGKKFNNFKNIQGDYQKTILGWENIKNKATFLFSINILGFFDIKTFLETLIDMYSDSEIKIKNVIENKLYLDVNSDFIKMAKEGDTVEFLTDNFKGKQQNIDAFKDILLKKDNYEKIFKEEEQRRKKIKNINIFYEFEINKGSETATIILCDTAKLESPTELSKSFYTDGKGIARPFISEGNQSYRDIKEENFNQILTGDEQKIYKDWNKNSSKNFENMTIISKLRTHIQTKIKKQIFLRESIKHLVKFLSKDGSLPTMKNNELLLTNYEKDYDNNTYIKTITEQDTTEITNIIKTLSNNKPCNFYLFSDIKFTANDLSKKEGEDSKVYTEKVKNILEFLDKIERTT
jgi:hypothetical protein